MYVYLQDFREYYKGKESYALVKDQKSKKYHLWIYQPIALVVTLLENMVMDRPKY